MDTQSPSHALDELLLLLNQIGAEHLSNEIRTVVTRGTVKEVAVERKSKISVREPYSPSEAYLLAVRMLIAAVDPLLMRQSVMRTIKKVDPQCSELRWSPDFLDNAVEEPRNFGLVDWPMASDELLKHLESLAEAVVKASDAFARDGSN